MTAFFAWHRKLTQRNIFSRHRSRNKREKIWEKNLFGQVGTLERDFSKPRISRFLVQILEVW